MSRTTLLASVVARAPRSHVSPIPLLGPLRQLAGGNQTQTNQKKRKTCPLRVLNPPPFEIKKVPAGIRTLARDLHVIRVQNQLPLATSCGPPLYRTVEKNNKNSP